MLIQDWRLWIIVFAFILAVVINVVLAIRIGAYHYAAKHVLAYTVFILPFLYIFVFKLIDIIQLDGDVRLSTLKDIGENITLNVASNYIILIAFGLTYFVERIIKNKNEDKEKLTSDFDALIAIYKGEEFVCSGDTKYPVVSLGEGDICIYKQGKTLEDLKEHVKIDDSKEMYVLPGLIEDSFSSIIKVHDTSVIYNNLNIRAKSLELKNNKLSLSTERTFYFFSLVTNRASDYDWAGDGITVRTLYEPGPKFLPLDQTCLSNHIGFNGFVATADGYIVFVKRSKDLSIAKRTYGDSIGASLKTKYALDDNGTFTEEKLVQSIVGEIKDELNLQDKDISNIHIISAYRDGLESGKPQLLIYAETNLDADVITKQFTEKSKEKISRDIESKKKSRDSKAMRRLKAEMKVIKDGSKLIWIKKDLLPDLQFSINGVKFINNTRGQEGFFKFKKKGESKKYLKKQHLPMVPSASASLVMFNHFHKSRVQLNNSESTSTGTALTNSESPASG